MGFEGFDTLESMVGRPASQSTRVALFTDTLGDVNGVSRFIRNVAACASATGRTLTVFTSTRFETPIAPNIRNVAPLFAARMPGYAQLEWALPPAATLLREARAFRPDVIHVSTPGPVGCVGWLAARLMRVPLAGVYHTDFPAYIDHLFRDPSYTAATAWFMRRFYRPFSCLFTRSEEYTQSLVGLGVARDRVVRLRAGIDTDAFHVRHRCPDVWDGLRDVDGQSMTSRSLKALYIGRVSVEKNLPMLARVWQRVSDRWNGARALELVVVGDGPYRREMQAALAGRRAPARFLGFRHGEELASIYASADLFVFPSLTDTLGQVVMEAQSSGLPVIVSNVGGPKEVVEEGRTGFVVNANDESAWAERILALASDEEARVRLGRAAHEHMRAQSIEQSFEHYWAEHERVRDSSRKAAPRTRR